MADSYIQVATDGTGKKMQTYLNTIGGQDVHAEAVALVDTNGNPIPELPVSIASNLNINLSQIVGTTVSTNIGNAGAGVQRVVLASDQPNVPVTIQNASIAITGGPLGTKETPDATSTYAPTNATTSAYAASLVIKGSAGVLFSITGYNSSGSDQFIQLHDASSLPSDTAVPAVVFKVRSGRNFSLSFGGKFGRYFSTGIVICNSSTGPTKTIGSADCWFDAQYS